MNRIKKILGQMKAEKQNKSNPNSNSVLIDALFGTQKTPAQQFREELKTLGEFFGYKTDDFSVVNMTKMIGAINIKLSTVPYIPFPTSFSTVDIFAQRYTREADFVMLGRKYNQTQYQLCGGFRDPKETNEQAAAREFHEEAQLDLSPDRFEYIKSKFVDDNRYKDSCHKITTHLFVVTLNRLEADMAKGGDDIEEVKWFDVMELSDKWYEIVRPVHHELFKFMMGNQFPHIVLAEQPKEDGTGTTTVQDVLPGDVQH